MSKHSDDPGIPQTILIAGTGRSGTTWLGKILDSSPLVFYKSQPDDRNLYPWFRDIPSRLDPTPEFDRFREPFARALRDTFWSYTSSLNPRPDFPKDFLRWPAWQTLSFALRGVRKLTRSSGPMITIPRAMFRGDPGAVTLAIKSVVSNMRLAWINRHFPQIRIVLIVRHPGGYLNSVFRGSRDHGWHQVGTKSRLTGAVVPFRRPEHEQYSDVYENGSDFERELVYWIVANETPILELGDSPALKVVVYEDLCARPEEVTQSVFDFLGLPMSDSTTCFLRESTTRHEAGYYAVYKDPLQTAYNWREELGEEKIAIIDKYLQCSSIGGLWGGHAAAVSATSDTT